MWGHSWLSQKWTLIMRSLSPYSVKSFIIQSLTIRQWSSDRDRPICWSVPKQCWSSITSRSCYQGKTIVVERKKNEQLLSLCEYSEGFLSSSHMVDKLAHNTETYLSIIEATLTSLWICAANQCEPELTLVCLWTRPGPQTDRMGCSLEGGGW